MQSKSRIQRSNSGFGEDVAIRGLTFLAADEERFLPFLTLSGFSPDSLRTAAANPSFLLGVLEYIMSDDAIATQFAEAEGLSGDDLAHAVHALSQR